MVTEQTKAKIETLRTLVASGKVYNADFKDLKHSIDSALWRDTDLRELVLASGDGKEGKPRTHNREYPGLSELYVALPTTVHEVKAAAKKYAKVREACPPAVVEATDEYLAFWLPVNELFALAKTMLVKGRKPSMSPRKDPRTLENTGTCPICDKNVKLSEYGTLVDHGFQLWLGNRIGPCPGVGAEPFEVSPKRATEYADALEVVLADLEKELALWEAGKVDKVFSERDRAYIERGDDRFEAMLTGQIVRRRAEIRSTKSRIVHFREKVEKWSPRTLPGKVAGFAK